ncbi:MAG TPA: NlpC/P60 family protein, partial [Pseudonocardiaceae bacterium]|nr:NlpC/P60 family protein [Pseudonocardiaceae bacterium]
MGGRVRRRMVRRGMAAAVLAVVALVEQPALAGAVPPPPPPSDDEFEAGRNRVTAVAAEAGRLANRIATADAALLDLQSEVALRREETNAALIELQQARAAATTARIAADAARAQADATTVQIAAVQRQIDQFAAGSYRQRSTIGSVAAFLGARTPHDLLDRAELLDAVGGARLDGLERMRLAHTRSANQHARAREALAAAVAAEQRAARAQRGAATAYEAVLVAVAAQSGRTEELRARKARIESRLAEAQQAVTELTGQRRRYAQWVTERDRETLVGPRTAEPGEASAPETDNPETGAAETDAAEAGAGEAVQTVIARAMAQRGVRYSWGGGDANGATIGIRDGGVADANGDYRAAGFDCSGLMIYAFAPVLGYSLPHYSGLQYRAGRRVPLAHRRPGD